MACGEWVVGRVMRVATVLLCYVSVKRRKGAHGYAPRGPEPSGEEGRLAAVPAWELSRTPHLVQVTLVTGSGSV
jgi:hypothetical protein